MQAPHPATYPAAARPRNGTLTHPHNGEDGLPGGAEKKRDLFGVAANGGAESEEKDVVLGVDEDQAIDGVDPVYAAKARVLNRAIMNIGMGRYQWQLFFVIGYGWAMDNMWPIVTSLILPAVANEFNVARPPLLTLAQNIGLLAGALLFGFGCDIFGRKIGFNATLAIIGIWGMVAASSPNFAAIGVFAALWSVGVGGNLPVDSAIFLEALPRTHQYLLTVLSIFWALAQVYATLIAWPLLGYRTCGSAEGCTRAANFGWRYFVIAMGGTTLLMFFVRFFIFHLYESPKYLMGKGQDEKAVEVVHAIAKRNGKTSNLTLDDLRICEGIVPGGVASVEIGAGTQQTGAASAIRRKLAAVDSNHVKGLFATKKLAFSTAAIMLVWALIGLAFPLYNAFLPYIQQQRGAQLGDGSTYLTYRNSLIIATLGVPGAIIGGILVEWRFFGRKITLAVATVLTGTFILASTTATTSNTLLAWNCMYNLFSNIMFAVLYSYTPEVFATKDRGTGNGLTAGSNRIFGIMAPIVAMFANLETAAPVYVSGALFVVAAFIVLALPYESRGKASL